MNWYKKIIAQNMTAYLESLGADPIIIQFITSQDPNSSQLLTNEFRKNPGLTIEQLQQTQLPQKSNIDPYLVYERNWAEINADESFKKWILVSFRKIRKGKIPSNPGEGIPSMDFLPPEEYNLYTVFARKVGEIRDWYMAIQPNIASFTPEQAISASNEWHRVMEGKGEGKIYETTKPELIAYGPEWKNKDWQGWTIQRIMSKNDLLVEGNRMGHCVGSYCEGVQNESLIIYSLRDPQNNPKATIETNATGEIVEQIEGHSNNVPDDDYRAMIFEWVTYDKNSPKQMKSGNEYYWELGGELQSISSQLDDLKSGYIGDQEDDYESYLAKDYGLEPSETPEFTRWLENFDIERLMEIIFEQITYEYSTEQPENINWYSTSIIENLISTVKHFDEENKSNYGIKLLISILKEQLEYSPTMLSDNKKEQQVQKSFAQTVLKIIYEPAEQREFSFASGMNWYKKNIDK